MFTQQATFQSWNDQLTRNPDSFYEIDADTLEYWQDAHREIYYRAKIQHLEQLVEPVNNYVLENFEGFDPAIHRDIYDFTLTVLQQIKE